MDEATAMNSEQSQDPVAGKKIAEVFGEIIWVMSQDTNYQALSLSDLEQFVMPPILLRQFHITYAPVKAIAPSARGGVKQADLQPVKVALFALVSDEVLGRKSTEEKIPRLRPEEWRSGEQRLTIIEAKIPGMY